MKTLENIKNIDKIIEKLKDTSIDLSFLKEEKAFRTEMWQIIKRNDEQSVKELIENIGEEQYGKLKKYIKDEHEDYYSMGYFRNGDIDSEQRKFLLVKIYNNSVVENNFIKLEQELNKAFTQKNLLKIVNCLQSVTDFCNSYNRSGEYLVKTLCAAFDLDASICTDLGYIYNNNKLLLKLNYMTKMLEKLLINSK